MLLPGSRIERTNLIVGIIGCLAGVAGTALAYFIYFKPPAQPAVPVQVEAISVVDEQLRAQNLRTAAISFRAVSADYVLPLKSREWQASEALFRKGEAFYSTKAYADAAICFDQAGRAFNDIYAAAQVANYQGTSDVDAGGAKLEAYIKELNKDIAALEEQKNRSSPLEAGESENAATRQIDEQLRDLRAVKKDAERKLYGISRN